MKRIARVALIAMLFLALPLRGYAGVLMISCGSQHGGAASVETHALEHGEGHHRDSGETDGSPHGASVCSLCASCCAGAGLALPTHRPLVFDVPLTDRIPFFDHQASGFVPEHLDRPPSAL